MTTPHSVERTLTYGTGWLAVSLLAAVVLLIPAVRVLGRREPPRPAWRWHARLGWAAAAVAAAHTVLSITPGPVPAAAEAGLWIASIAAVAVGLEVALGRLLLTPRVTARQRLVLHHLRLTPVIGGLVALHVVLNWEYVIPR